MLKQKSGLGFKPKAPQARRNTQSSPQLPERHGTDERQSQTPVPQPSGNTEKRSSTQPFAVSTRPERDTTPSNVETLRTLNDDAFRANSMRAGDAPPAKRARTGPMTAAERSQPDAAPIANITSDVASRPTTRKVTAVAPPTIPSSTRRSSPPRISTTPIPLPASVQKLVAQPVRSTAQGPASHNDSAAPAAGPSEQRVPRKAANLPSHKTPRPSIEVVEDNKASDEGCQPARGKRSQIVVGISSRAPGSRKQTKAKKPAHSGISKTQRRGQHAVADVADIASAASTDSYEEEAQDDDGRNGADGESTLDEDTAENEEVPPKKKHRKRSVTPEDAESLEVDPRQVKMADLAKDLRIGKKFEKHDEIKQREKVRRAQARLAAKLRLKGPNPEADGSQATESAPAPADGADRATTPEERVISYAIATSAGPQFEVIDGQIVVNQQSLQVDRHALAAAEAGEMVQVEEDDFSRRITSASYRRKPLGPNHWTFAETERFYRALRMFGTNFQMISYMFPGKDRRQVKLKFNREEKLSPKRVNAALIGDQRMQLDLDEFREFADMQLESVEDIEEELRVREEEHEAAERRKEDEAAETAAQKRAELYAGREPENNDPSQVDGAEGGAGGEAKTRRKRGPRKKVQEIDTGFGI
jgi:transcription factor TFIIIB component B''